jgi:hypothetical protein
MVYLINSFFRISSVFIILIITNFSCLIAQNLNQSLKQQLDSLHQQDQLLREMMAKDVSEVKRQQVLEKFGINPEAFNKDPWEFIRYFDSINMVMIKKIIEQYGYPGRSLVGEPTYITAWLILQHSSEIETYFPLVKKAGELGEIGLDLVATMEDRMLMYRGELQNYGTQSSSGYVRDPVSGERILKPFIWPVKEPENVNERRKSMGFGTTIEEYARILGVEYQVLTLDNITSPF